MSDFDAVLERMITDRRFAAALADDPAQALAGYQLTPDEVELLYTQVNEEHGGERSVEVRANQSSLFGMLSPIGGPLGPGSGGLIAGSGGDLGHQPAEGFGAAHPNEGWGPVGGAGGAALDDAAATVEAGLGPAPVAEEGLGPAPVAEEGLGPAAVAEEGFGAAAEVGAQATGTGGQVTPDLSPPPGYRTRVDVDGDGVWDPHLLIGRPDGGVDILVDADGDGRVDFIGHDTDGDGLVDWAEYDKDGDGFFEKRMYDDNGDGWLDRAVRVEPPESKE